MFLKSSYYSDIYPREGQGQDVSIVTIVVAWHCYWRQRAENLSTFPGHQFCMFREKGFMSETGWNVDLL